MQFYEGFPIKVSLTFQNLPNNIGDSNQGYTCPCFLVQVQPQSLSRMIFVKFNYPHLHWQNLPINIGDSNCDYTCPSFLVQVQHSHYHGWLLSNLIMLFSEGFQIKFLLTMAKFASKHWHQQLWPYLPQFSSSNIAIVTIVDFFIKFCQCK